LPSLDLHHLLRVMAQDSSMWQSHLPLHSRQTVVSMILGNRHDVKQTSRTRYIHSSIDSLLLSNSPMTVLRCEQSTSSNIAKLARQISLENNSEPQSSKRYDNLVYQLVVSSALDRSRINVSSMSHSGDSHRSYHRLSRVHSHDLGNSIVRLLPLLIVRFSLEI
jgi:hypothetical protein